MNKSLGKGSGLKLRDVRAFKRKQRLGRIGRGVLLAVGAVGFLLAAGMGSNAVALFDNTKDIRRKKLYMKNVADGLVAKCLLKRTKNKQGAGYELTSKGEALAASYELQELTIDKPWRWDGKWRLVISDLPEYLKPVREELRSILVGLGFVPIQKSVWAFPHPCADIITLLKKRFDLNKQVLYIEVDVLENDSWLRDIFFLN